MTSLRWLIKKVQKETCLTGEDLVNEVLKELKAKEFYKDEELIEIRRELRERILGR